MNVRRITTLGITAVAAGLIGLVGTGVAEAAATADTAPGQIVVIDAGADKDAAITALKLYQNATDRSFVPSADPTYGQTGWDLVTDQHGQPAPSVTGNAKTGQKITESLEISHEQGSSWSLGGSISTSVGFDLTGIVDAELSMKVTANHIWQSSVTDSQSISVTADPGKTVWIEAATDTATYTGDFLFTSGGTHYDVKNVTITQPAAQNTQDVSPVDYRVMETSSTQAGLPKDTAGGLTAINSLPNLKNFIAAGH